MKTVTDTELIQIDFGDWLFNAGILGFYRIITENNDDKKPEDFVIGDNYISFKREHLQAFSEKYFNTAFNQYGRFEGNKKTFKEFIHEIDSIDLSTDKQEIKEKKLKRISDRFKSITATKLLSAKLKENDINAPSFNDFKKDPKLFIPVLEKVLKVLEDNKAEFFESDVQIYLRWIYGQKSFLNNSVNKDRQEKFKKDFEEPLLNSSNKEDKKLKCINCCKRQAKKDINFDTGLSPFLGVNTDSVNYLWNFDPRIPLCEICELIYFCYFAGFTDVVKGKERKFYFVNSDSDFETLKKDNNLFKHIVKEKLISKEDSESYIPSFITELLQQEEHKSNIVYSNKILIELDLTNETFPKVFSLNINKSKSEFIKNNIDKIKALARASYTIKDYHENIGIEFINQIIKSKVSYSYLSKLSKYFVNSTDKSDFYKCYFNYYHLQELNLLIFAYKSMFKERLEMKTELNPKELWFIYNDGISLKNIINARNNKIDESNKDDKSHNERKVKGLAHKLLNSLRIGNTEQFLNLVMRTYMANEVPVPSIFIKSIQEKELFYPIGYSFVNGLLGKEKKEDKKDNNKEEGENNG